MVLQFVVFAVCGICLLCLEFVVCYLYHLYFIVFRDFQHTFGFCLFEVDGVSYGWLGLSLCVCPGQSGQLYPHVALWQLG